MYTARQGTLPSAFMVSLGGEEVETACFEVGGRGG